MRDRYNYFIDIITQLYPSVNTYLLIIFNYFLLIHNLIFIMYIPFVITHSIYMKKERNSLFLSFFIGLIISYMSYYNLLLIDDRQFISIHIWHHVVIYHTPYLPSNTYMTIIKYYLCIWWSSYKSIMYVSYLSNIHN